MTRTQNARANRLGYATPGVSGMFIANSLRLSVEAANALRLEGYRTADNELERDAVEALNWIRAGRNPHDARRFAAQRCCTVLASRPSNFF